MLEPYFYYVCPESDGSWMLHKAGCFVLEFENEKRFIGSLYTSHQALTVARVHCATVVCCSVCLPASPKPDDQDAP